MFVNQDLQNHLETSSSIRINSLVVAEWNMNVASNILKVGNYRYRPTSTEEDKYSRIAESFSSDDSESLFYTGATDADVVIDGGFDDNDLPMVFLSSKEKEKMLYSLEDCFGKFRPRSGINKLRYFENKYSHNDSIFLAQRPRYYMADKNDKFKYWSSFRTESDTSTGKTIYRGFSNTVLNNRYYIDDAAPFVVYKNPVPANRIVVKMQTNVGDVDLGPFSSSSGTYEDPFFGDANKTTPVRWKIQGLINNNWNEIISFDELSQRRDGSPIIGSNGYLEIGYGLVIPDQYYNIFRFEKTLASSSLLPLASDLQDGDAFLIFNSLDEQGTVHIVIDGEFETFQAEYGWQIIDDINRSVSFVNDLTSPEKFVNTNLVGDVYRDFQYLGGLRIVVETMNKLNSTFDLIELSPRLTVNISDKVTSFSVKKPASDLGISGLPVGQLLAGTGSVEIFDYDQAFFKENQNSIIKDYTSQNIQLKIYEVVEDVNGADYFVPIKTMYSEGFPAINNNDRTVSLPTRDLFFYFESTTAPQILLQNASLSYAVSMVLDSIGFSNYSFKRNENESEEVIPYFYIEPDTSVAQVLEGLARSTQSAMFFDEYNNFIVMSKGYMMPSENERPTDITLYGSKDFSDTGVVKNISTSQKLSNIINISSQDNYVYNDGIITYATRYIQRSYSSIKQAQLLDRDKTWIYKPSLIWEVAATENIKSVNQEVSEQSAYSLAAIPLNSDLTDQIPFVSNNQINNNTMDLGDGIYWLTRYNGYLYANGEVIKFDAVQFSIPGLSSSEKTEDGTDNVWISSVREYQRYFAKLPFNGKIYPTGLVRIYCEPKYETVSGITRFTNGNVAKHGRGQFGTEIVYHHAGLSEYWQSDDNIRGISMASKYLFGGTETYNLLKDVVLESNSPFAILAVSDISFIQVGDFVEKYVPTGTTSEGNDIPDGTYVTQIDTDENLIFLSSTLLNATVGSTISGIKIIDRMPNAVVPSANSFAAGSSNTVAAETNRTSLIKNFLATQYVSEIPGSPRYPATTQSSALIMEGSDSILNTTDQVSYIYKSLDNRFRHFGTRFRIVGKVKNNDVRGQEADGSSTYFTISDADNSKDVTIAGASAGISVMVNPNTNSGYFFELVALSSAQKTSDYSNDENVANMFFYKVMADENATDSSLKALPIKLWSGIGDILVDSGDFVGQSRLSSDGSATVYDVAVEYQELGNGLRFYLYVNNVIVAIVDDTDPLPIYNNMALFIRGASKAMFENIYALTENYSQNTSFSLDTPANQIFGVENLNADNSFRRYAMSGLIQSTYLSGLGPNDPPQYKIYFEEFGTIMREAAYFNVRYDKAYPVLSAKISPTFSRVKGYTVSGFRAGSYGAEFLIFNNTDSALNLDSSSGNYLRIQGVAFTQQSNDELSVDEYFERISNLSDPEISESQIAISPEVAKETYQDIKLNRMTYGRKEFSIDAPYIQSQDSANSLMSWLTQKIMKTRKSVGMEVFGLPTVQLGDVVAIDYINELGIREISSEESRFIVYYIEYDRKDSGPSTTLYLSEVV